MSKRYKTNTLEGYRRMLEAVYPAIGGLPLCKIRPMVLEELCEELRQRHGRNGQSLSENTVHKYLDTISAVLQDAVKNDILLYNPAHRVDKLRVEHTPQRIPQAWEMQKLLQCILQEPLLYRVYYLLALSTGLRRGELCALRWSDLHGGNQLLIQHSRSTVVGKGVIESDTKSHRTRVVVLLQEEDYLFRQPNGDPMVPTSFTFRFKKILRQNGLPENLNVHSLRHTNASLLIAQGVDVRTVASLLGHSQASTTLDIYAHTFDKKKREAQEKLGEVMGL